MSYQILLVDDESIDLEWMKRLVAGCIDKLEIAGAVNSAFAAITILQDRPIDILLSDIRMPIMSGLYLAAKARQLQPLIKIAFVSGHEDFHYAKEAIKVSASAYLLKPVEDHELRDTLLELTSQLDEERQFAAAGKQWQETLPILEKELVLGWLEGASTPQAEHVVEEALRHITAGNSLAVVLIEIDDWEWKLSPLPEAERAELIAGVFQAIEACYKERNSGYFIRDKDHGMALITGCGNDELLAAGGDIVAMVKVRFPVTITIGLGSHVQRGADLRSSYKQAKLALKEKLFLGKNQVISHSNVKRPVGPTVRNEPIGVDLDGTCEAILRDMVNYRLVAVDSRLELLFLQAGKFREKATIIHFIVQFISRLHMHCQQMNENLYELLNWEYVHLNVMFQFETMHDMNSWLRRKLFELSERLYIKNQKLNRKIIDAIREYIDFQLASKITLKQVAGHFNFSPNYLGQMFKEESGEHFSNYLIRARIKRACELLLDPLLKVYEIADQMGYKNIKYFNRQFKQLTGVTPGDYRKANKI